MHVYDCQIKKETISDYLKIWNVKNSAMHTKSMNKISIYLI